MSDGDKDNDGDNGNGTDWNDKDRGFAGRPEFRTEGTERDGIGEEGREMTVAEQNGDKDMKTHAKTALARVID
ncbi:MAG: hypothetical protein HYX59_10150 [Elusimicrobia bacterium]|nr:hypothetical protein [Elusimicrobiota bacterium]